MEEWERRAVRGCDVAGLPERRFSRGADDWPLGQLSKTGAQEAEALGRRIRETYGAALLDGLVAGCEGEREEEGGGGGEGEGGGETEGEGDVRRKEGIPGARDADRGVNVHPSDLRVYQSALDEACGMKHGSGAVADSSLTQCGGSRETETETETETSLKRETEASCLAQSLAAAIRVRATSFPRTYHSAFFMLRGLLGSQAAAAAACGAMEIREDKDETLIDSGRCERATQLAHSAWRRVTQGLPPLTPPSDAPAAPAAAAAASAASVAAASLDGVLPAAGSAPNAPPSAVGAATKGATTTGSTTTVGGDGGGGGWRKKQVHAREALRTVLGLPSGPFPWPWAIDFVHCCHHHGDPLPLHITPPLIHSIRSLIAQDYAKVYSCRPVARLSMGPLLRDLHRCLSHCICANNTSYSSSSSSAAPTTTTTPPPSPRLHLYSAHDVTLLPLAASLGVPYVSWPVYTSSLAIELWAEPPPSKRTRPPHAHSLSHTSAPLASTSADRPSSSRARIFVRVLRDFEPVALPRRVPDGEASSWLVVGDCGKEEEMVSGSLLGDGGSAVRLMTRDETVPLSCRVPEGEASSWLVDRGWEGEQVLFGRQPGDGGSDAGLMTWGKTAPVPGRVPEGEAVTQASTWLVDDSEQEEEQVLDGWQLGDGEDADVGVLSRSVPPSPLEELCSWDHFERIMLWTCAPGGDE
ncbi:hypothetical protein CLOM_g18147 [Closterium sp. NIES-68]|nr:hypothetical protein CLOM_g18147 [Closterium sp. NIES-68]GJP63297.1 hypothetical protein CLOP_g20370 [Closterium sp. NIES-67]